MLSPAKRYAQGLSAPLRGLGFVRKNRFLWKWVLPPALVNTLITLAALVMAVWLSWWLVGEVWPLYGNTFWQWVFKIAAAVGIVLGVIGLTVVVWLVLTSVCAGYLLGVLAGRVERQLGLAEDEIHELSLVREGAEAVVETAVIIGIHLFGFVAQFIPFVGQFIALPAVLITDAYVLGWEVMGYPLGVRGMTLKDRSAFLKRHRPETLGVGTTLLPVMAVPVVGGFMMCFATVGAVLLHRDLIAVENADEQA